MKKLDPFHFFFKIDEKGNLLKDNNGLFCPIPLKVLIFVPSYDWREKLLQCLSIRNFKGCKIEVSESKEHSVTVITRVNGRFEKKFAHSIADVYNILKTIP